ncbi:hypothetical protein ABTJ88_19645, partial [Acinetobacter baumannii]
ETPAPTQIAAAGDTASGSAELDWTASSAPVASASGAKAITKDSVKSVDAVTPVAESETTRAVAPATSAPVAAETPVPAGETQI